MTSFLTSVLLSSGGGHQRNPPHTTPHHTYYLQEATAGLSAHRVCIPPYLFIIAPEHTNPVVYEQAEVLHAALHRAVTLQVKAAASAFHDQ